MPLPDRRGPSGWLPILGSAVITVSGLVWTASQRDADARHEKEARVALERRVEVLEGFRGDVREVLAGLKAEVGGMRKDIGELTMLIRGKSRQPKED